MKHLLKLNEYQEFTLEGDWQEISPDEYWEYNPPSNAFSKYELNLINSICDKNHLRVISWGFGTSIRISRETSTNNDRLWDITVVKHEDEWFSIFMTTCNSNVLMFYKADQIGGLMNFLEIKIKEMNIKYNR
jgi:hypothetical protein